MSGSITARGVSKLFPRMHKDRPMTVQEIFSKGLGRMRAVDTFWALDDVSFEVAPGNIAGVLGFNGAGKSTLLRLVAGIGRPTKGSVELEGRIGSILDLGVGFHPELTGRENIFVSGVTSGLTRREVEKRFDSIVDFSELTADVLESPVRTYSSGMNLRLAFSVASHIEPEVLLVDEVLAVGDLRFQRKCFQRLMEFKERGCTGLIATHSPELVARLCDQAIWLDDGRVRAIGGAEEIAEQYLEATGADELLPGAGLIPAEAASG
jgi:lipopolysaccharide transport system ATP-binding protein